MPISGSLYIENLILVAGIAGISKDLLLIGLEEEDKADASASARLLTSDVLILLSKNDATAMEDKRIVNMTRKYNINI